MHADHIVLLQSDPHVAEMLRASLDHSFNGVHVAQSLDDLRHVIAKHQPLVIIVDLEAIGFTEVEALKREFAAARIVCNHRVADEEMWTRTLAAGGDDCCPSSDTRAILAAAMPRAAAAGGLAA